MKRLEKGQNNKAISPRAMTLIASTALALTTPVAAMVAPASAQDVAEEAEKTFATVVVTARKREESLLDISGSVQVLDDDLLDDFNLDEVDLVIDLVPNATFNAAPSGTPVIAIRGLGTRPGSAMLEQDVGLFVDGVWLGRNNQLNSALVDVAQIEVLKGTQATLYGRNTLAGAVSVQTKKPGKDFEGYVNAGYEFEHDSQYVEGAVTVPLSERLSVRLASKYEDEGGYVRNTVLNREEAESENVTVRGTAVYDGDSGLELIGRLQFTDRERTGNVFIREEQSVGVTEPFEFTPSPFPAPVLVGYDENALGRQITVPVIDLPDVGSDIEFLDWSFTAEMPVGDLTLTSITAGSSMDLESVFDVFLSSPPGPRVIGYFDEDYDQFTQEVRLTSPSDGNFQYIVGAFYLDQSVDRLTYQYVNTADRFWSGEQDVSSWAVFASGTYSLTDRARIVGGLRFTDETKDADVIVHGQQEPDLAFANVVETVETDFASGSATLEFDVTDNLLLFGGYSRGSKAPGLVDGANVQTNALFQAQPSLFIAQEDINTYETGFKWEQSNGFINATAFYLDVTDFQNAALTNGEIVISSFDVEILGAEIDTFHNLNHEWSLATAWGFLDGENADTGGNITSAPSFTSSATLTYETDTLIEGYLSRGSINLNHKSSHYLNAVSNPANKVDSVTTLNANIGLTHQASGIDVSLVGKNITNEIYQDFAFGGQAFLGTEHMYGVAAPRTVALEVGFDF